ncbi:uncharacterized protein BYT42DRAFT_566404 [Radiomyces spectabilis]|uniref:uncharacterized protein n=1 Tax=Radiomyces spectabilis TaxID=64574 RepID=UPI00221F97C7|nr:uncharacterized protein BYT42DRAFT_566404 [Radiomyces spectabilis]KAI8381406.1 hypothetical protein BYT42DRAFT_566404 [Radiomyces spectabilis]
MSHQSGIQVSEELAKTFAEAVADGNTRILRVSIINESLTPNGSTPVKGNFEQDYDDITSFLEDTTPAYILMRLDTKASSGEYEWLLVTYVPDHAKVRDKMLYASTRNTLTKELGDYRFTDTLYGTLSSEVSLDGYRKHQKHKAAEAPLTQRERELAEIKQAEAKAVSDYQGTTTRKSYAPGVAFPVTEKAQEALRVLNQSKEAREHNFVSLVFDKETIDLDTASHVPRSEIKNAIPAHAPRFTFYVCEHESDGNTQESIVFVYTCPPSSKIREKMLYSASRANIIKAAESMADLKVVKKLETSDPTDITEEYLLEELAPPVSTRPSSSSSVDSRGSGSSVVSDRIQMLGGTRAGGFKRPVPPGRRRPTGNQS